VKTLLFTPGPLSTSDRVRAALDRDWGSRENDFIGLTRSVRDTLVRLAGGDERHTCVPLQGSGTFAVEAALDSFAPQTGKTLVLVNGAYGRRAVDILTRLGRAHLVHETAETELPAAADIVDLLNDNPDVTAVFMVHCETTTGIVNPLRDVQSIAAARGLMLIVDAMSSFGCFDLGAVLEDDGIVVASANKCLQGVPGIGFVIVRRTTIASAAGRARSLSLDLHAQWAELERSGQWRFTPPVQVVAAMQAALLELQDEGGIAARRARYTANRDTIVRRFAEMGLAPVLRPGLQSPVIVTFPLPKELVERFGEFHQRLASRGFVIYPGKLTRQPTFRVGCIGALIPQDMAALADQLAAVLHELGIAVPVAT
jgi:2-aminoethylphosphonate-pyruvate transaminase